MSKTNTFETSFLNHIFTNSAIANIGDASGLPAAATAGSLYIALYTVAPTESTTGTESAYGAYARVAVARNGSNWTVSGNQVSNTNTVTFTEATSGSETIVAFAIMTASSGGDQLLYGNVSPTLSVSTNVTPRFAATELTVTEN